jgi:hypothetical protein
MKPPPVMTRLEPDHCLACGEMCDASTAAFGEAAPRPGALTVCFYCGHLMAFGEGLRLRELTDAECHAVAGDEGLLKIQRARGELAKYRRERVAAAGQASQQGEHHHHRDNGNCRDEDNVDDLRNRPADAKQAEQPRDKKAQNGDNGRGDNQPNDQVR